MYINPDLLERTCKNTIETILFCLRNATKGTIYTIGPMPELRAVRITSGIRNGANDDISWGLSQTSGYNPPGKCWEDYRDAPGNFLEAMGWCVEHQKSWTADNPAENIRSVRKQVEGKLEDCHHMEPVLVRKTDLYENRVSSLEYPLDWRGNPIWQNTEYVAVAVIKIHFLHPIRRGDASTKIIKKLSKTLGTEWLSLYLRETYLEARQRLTLHRLHSCNVIAHELRNTLIKLGFVFPAINAVMAVLREQWEMELEKTFPQLETKRSILELLNQFIVSAQAELDGRNELLQLSNALLAEQEEFAHVFLLLEQEEQWFRSRIQPKWQRLLAESTAWHSKRQAIQELLASLEKSIQIATHEDLANNMDLPEGLRALWPKLIHTSLSANNVSSLGDVLLSFENPEFNITHKEQLKKILNCLRVLAEVVCKIEGQTNDMIFFLKNGESLENKPEVL